MRFRISELLERELKLVPGDGIDQAEMCRVLAAAGVDAVEDDNTFQEKDYWDGRGVPLAHRNMSCTLAPGAIELKMPMAGPSYLYREFALHGDGPIDAFRDPWFWNAPGLATVRSTFATPADFHAFVTSLQPIANCRARRTYYWLTDDDICKRGDYFAHDTVLVFDRVQGYVDGKATTPYVEVEIEVTRWAPFEISAIAKRALDALLAHGFREAPVSKYRRICQLAGLVA